VTEPTETVDTGNVAVFVPSAIVTIEGTVATAVLPLVSVTLAPPEGATPFKATVPVEVAPPVSDSGFKLKMETVGPDCPLSGPPSVKVGSVVNE